MSQVQVEVQNNEEKEKLFSLVKAVIEALLNPISKVAQKGPGE